MNRHRRRSAVSLNADRKSRVPSRFSRRIVVLSVRAGAARVFRDFGSVQSEESCSGFDRSERGVVVNFSAYPCVYSKTTLLRRCVRSPSMPSWDFLSSFDYSSLLLLLTLSLFFFLSLFLASACSLSGFQGEKHTGNLLAAQIKIEQPAIKRKWGYWPEPLSPIIDFHFAAAAFERVARSPFCFSIVT